MCYNQFAKQIIDLINFKGGNNIMNGEYYLRRKALKGYLFEIIIMELLRKNQFSCINVEEEARDRVRENRIGFIEFKGRGCWHQIDCPCDYNKLIPFSYPLRLLGEVKFYKNPISKEHIREYVGIIKDIQENYFVADGINPQDLYPRKYEIGVYFSANGFQEEAEKLAYAHGIKTISYKNNFLVNRLKLLLDDFESNYISIKCLNNNVWKDFRQSFINALRFDYFNNDIAYNAFLADGYDVLINNLRERLISIESSFIATTTTGVFLHFIGESAFPIELFEHTDEGRCRIYYNTDDFGEKYFWMEISDDILRRKFYFTPPESLDYAAVFGNEVVLNEKERLFRVLSVNVNTNGISRSLILHLDKDWLEDVRENIR